MKIQCNVCEAAEAAVLCCADEAALCLDCDRKVHAANKLASKHQRVPLSANSSQMPKCDICQETAGYFFCLEDRALLCRKCDVAIHSVNSYVSTHQRFLLTGVKVGLEYVDPGASMSSGMSHTCEKISGAESRALPNDHVPITASVQHSKVSPFQVATNGDATHKMSFSGGSSADNIQQWQFDDLLGFPDFNQNYGYMDNGPSKADSGKLGDLYGSPILRAADLELDSDDCLGQVPDSSWAVPEIPSPPTASGLCWPKSYLHQVDNAAFVPDVSFSSVPTFYGAQPSGSSFKRRRQF